MGRYISREYGDFSGFLQVHQLEYDAALAEIKNGKKFTHQVWHFFPQPLGISKNDMALFFGLKNESEARLYYNHPMLGRHLVEICQAILDLEFHDISNVMDRDAPKLRACMTLFKITVPENKLFYDVLKKFYDGKTDNNTLRIFFPESINGKKYVSPAEYAKICGRTVCRIQVLCQQNRFKSAYKANGRWWIDPDEPYPANLHENISTKDKRKEKMMVEYRREGLDEDDVQRRFEDEWNQIFS